MYRFTIRGTVQGVGFRPYIYNACTERDLRGFVQNTGDGVVVEVSDRDAFEKILNNLPTNAKIDSYEVETVKADHQSFTIRQTEGVGYAAIPPDYFLCEECLQELNDPENRRYRYFFTTCTNCGPRFSITKKVPYDRDATTMAEFPMCEACKAEYEDPKNRRYHAQTIACHDCGPELVLYSRENILSNSAEDAIRQTADLLRQGEIVAIKGIGGYHLAANTESATIAKLKKLTGRTDKPFAIMCRDMDMVQTVAHPNEKQEEVLKSPERSIVLVQKKSEIDAVTELNTVGVMLPYSALHYLLFDHIDAPIVMTSSNASNEPITTHREDQLPLYTLDHSREIANVADDSVVKVIAGHPFYIRRSRGFVPQSFDLPASDKNILALGAEMNNTFCVYKKEGKAIFSQHMGNTANLASFEHYKDTIQTFLDFTQTTPDLIVADLHPSYNTSQYGELLSEQLQVPLQKVQHHKAHAYGVALEHGLADFVAIVADGTGYGEDGTIWGGEVFHTGERIGHLEQHLQLGGDAASRYPARMAFSILRNFLSPDEVSEYMQSFFTVPELMMLEKQREDRFNAPLTSSCGRVLDAAAFLLGFCDERTYDGRPAMLLEANAFGPLPLEPVLQDNVLMTTPLFEFLIKNCDEDKKRLAATVQKYLADGLYEIAYKYATGLTYLDEVRGAREREPESYSTYGEGASDRSNKEIHQIRKSWDKPIVFSGGCAYNTIMSGNLMEKGVLVNKNAPAGDGGISFGQVAYVLSASPYKS